MLKTLAATRYVTPLREGGSLPAVVEANDHSLYVMKFVGAGQGAKALIAELVAGEIGRALGLRVPEIVLMELDPAIGRSEPDAEVQDLLRASAGLNLGLRYLSNAFAYNPLLEPPPGPELASTVVWFDAYVTNVDRTARNVNMLLCQEELWLIDHGAALFFHHDWRDYLARSRSPFPLVKNHVLLPFATELDTIDRQLRRQLTPSLLTEVVDLIPEVWLATEPPFDSNADHRDAYVAYLQSRLEAAPLFVQEAVHARARLL